MTERSVSNTRKLTATAVLAAAAYLLAFLEFPVPLTPAFARMDLSDLPALIGAFAFGPVTGVMIELVKNLLGLMTSSTGGVGELANFLMGASYVFTAGVVYRHHKTKRMALAGGVAGAMGLHRRNRKSLVCGIHVSQKSSAKQTHGEKRRSLAAGD